MKKYILFDNDGVLVETEMWYYEANKKVFKEIFKLPLHEEEYLKLMAKGTTCWTIAKKMGFTEADVSRARIQRNIFYQEFIQNEDILIPGAKEVIASLHGKINMAIITTSRREDFEIIHHEKAITQYMDFVLCEGEYSHVKPHPAPYLKGLERFGADPEATLVVEDSERGLTSAVAAGIECVIVKNEFTKSHDFSSATHFIETLNELHTLL
jgi:HAD superfamily hydrolase (TIGR01509 family)